MVGPNGYVPGARQYEKQSVEKKILKTAVKVGSVLKEKVPEAINYIKEEIAPSSGPSLPAQAQYNDPYGNNASRIERQRQDQIDGHNDDEEYNEDTAWGDVKQAKRDVIDTGNHGHDYDRSPKDYGIKRDSYGDSYGRDKKFDYDNYRNNFDRNNNRYSDDKDRENRYSGGGYGGNNDFGFGDRDRRDTEPKKDGSSSFFDFDMGGPAQGNNDRDRRSRSRSRSGDRYGSASKDFNKQNPLENNDYFKNQEYWRQKREAASKA